MNKWTFYLLIPFAVVAFAAADDDVTNHRNGVLGDMINRNLVLLTLMSSFGFVSVLELTIDINFINRRVYKFILMIISHLIGAWGLF